jgi:hypothetical protein
VAHLALPAQLNIDLNSGRHEQHQMRAALPRPQTHPAAARQHEPITQEMNSDPAMRGRRSWAELEAAQQRMVELCGGRILLISGSTTSGNCHWNSTSAAWMSASLHVSRLCMPWPPLFSRGSCPNA